MKRFLLSLFIITAISFFNISVVFAREDTEDIRTEIKILKNYIQEMDKRLTNQIQEMDKRLTSQIGSLRNEMDSLRNEMDSLHSAINADRWLLVFLVGLGLIPVISKFTESKKETSELEKLKKQVEKIMEVLTKDGKIL